MWPENYKSALDSLRQHWQIDYHSFGTHSQKMMQNIVHLLLHRHCVVYSDFESTHTDFFPDGIVRRRMDILKLKPENRNVEQLLLLFLQNVCHRHYLLCSMVEMNFNPLRSLLYDKTFHR